MIKFSYTKSIFKSQSGQLKYKYQKRPDNMRRDNNIIKHIERDLNEQLRI